MSSREGKLRLISRSSVIAMSALSRPASPGTIEPRATPVAAAVAARNWRRVGWSVRCMATPGSRFLGAGSGIVDPGHLRDQLIECGEREGGVSGEPGGRVAREGRQARVAD